MYVDISERSSRKHDDAPVRRAEARARARAPYGSIISTIRAPFLPLGAAEAPPEPSLCASEVLLMLLRPPKPRKNSGRTAGEASLKLPSKMRAFPMPSCAPLTRNRGPMMGGRRHYRHPGKQALASVPPHWTMTARPDLDVASVAGTAITASDSSPGSCLCFLSVH